MHHAAYVVLVDGSSVAAGVAFDKGRQVGQGSPYWHELESDFKGTL